MRCPVFTLAIAYRTSYGRHAWDVMRCPVFTLALAYRTSWYRHTALDRHLILEVSVLEHAFHDVVHLRLFDQTLAQYSTSSLRPDPNSVPFTMVRTCACWASIPYLSAAARVGCYLAGVKLHAHILHRYVNLCRLYSSAQ